MSKGQFPLLKRNELTTLQVNIGYKCNQSCIHCHVNAGPHRWEMMDSVTLDLIPKILELYNLKILDITGGAPEMHPRFKSLVLKARSMGVEVIDRCNLTILSEPGYEDLSLFLADNEVEITASLPCYQEDSVDKQRGKGVFQRSITGLKELNKHGYGLPDSGLNLNLVFNPQGINLPPPQNELEKVFKEQLYQNYGIHFTSLFTITNMPIKRFKNQLQLSGQLDQYKKLLEDSHNPQNLETVMCRSLLSVDWQGYIFDCDFNQQLGIKIEQGPIHIKHLLLEKTKWEGRQIKVASHCFGCTAGNGSSCGGALSD